MRYNKPVIKSFADKHTSMIWRREPVRIFALELQIAALKKLRMLNQSRNINDLRIPPSNHLEKLSGNLKGYYSIRINKQWRLCFRFHEGDAYEVKILDYH